MKTKFTYERTIRVPLKSQYDYVIYKHGIEVEYTDHEMDDLSIINSEEFKEMQKSIDKIQRKCIIDETGIKELPMDNVKVKIKRRNK